MMQHSFGNPVVCVKCGQPVNAVWSYTWIDATGGLGICNACKAKAQETPAPQLAALDPAETVAETESGSEGQA